MGLTESRFGAVDDASRHSERPLAIVMVGGLVSSTLFTLLVLPAVDARCGAPRAETGEAAR
jgi:Cu/Ag efflux pump CusA